MKKKPKLTPTMRRELIRIKQDWEGDKIKYHRACVPLTSLEGYWQGVKDAYRECAKDLEFFIKFFK